MKYVFLIYDSRSGSTLLAAMLNGIKEFSVIPETNFINRLLVVPHHKITSMSNLATVEFLKEEPHFGELGIDDSRLLAAMEQKSGPSLLRRVTESIFEAYLDESAADSPEASVKILKCGASIFHLSDLYKIFPDAYFLHIVRDGRAVCASKIKSIDSWGNRFDPSVYGNAHHWRKAIRLVDAFVGNVYEVRYEELLHDPEEILLQISKWIGEEVSGVDVQTGLSEYVDKIGNRQKRTHENIGAPIISRISKWKTELSWHEVATFEWYAKQELIEKKYQLLSPVQKSFWRRCSLPFFIIWHYCCFWLRRLSRISRYRSESRLQERLRIWLRT